MDEIKTKQQVVEKIKEASKILVTVSNSPSVDELSAALALTLLLDKQEKYATAIFSGETPPAIAFLEPEKTFDDTTDSLRDFIIALNKEKADHLRYKVVEDAVKIFITPYKTTIDETDLEFSQGDYNVELVVALGVNNQDHLDKALEDHGQILHDAAIITMTAGDQTSTLGGIDWHDSNSSSLSEMVAGLAEALKTDKKKPLLDAPIATALLTGIVAETDRFSNERTTSKAMTVAGALMAAGADQQLIANELEASQEITVEPAEEPEDSEVVDEDNDSDVEIDSTSGDGSLTIKKDRDDTALAIKHEGETLADLDRRVLGEEKAKEKVIEEIEHVEGAAAQAEATEAAATALKEATEASKVSEESGPEQAPEVVPVPEPAPEATSAVNDLVSNAYANEEASQEPTLGGTLNATTEQAADDTRREIENDQNRTILAHSYLGGGDAATPQTPGSVAVSAVPETNEPTVPEPVHSAYAFDAAPAPADAASADPSSIAFGGERVIQPLSDSAPAPEAVASAYAPVDTPVGTGVDAPAAPEFQPFNPAPAPEAVAAPVEPVAAYGPSPFDAPASFTPPAPEPLPEPAPLPAPEQTTAESQVAPGDFGLPLPPPLPDFSQMNGAPAPAIPLPTAPQPEILGDILAPEPQQESMVYEPQPPFAPQPEPQFATQPEPVQQAAPADPAQFQIPTQQ